MKSTHNLSKCLRVWLLAIMSGAAAAQDEPPPGTEKVKVDYDLIFPDEKMPEMVKPEDANPFIAMEDSEDRSKEGSTEENIVKERLLAMKVVGVSTRPSGYRVALGDLWLEAGVDVPPFLPDQSVRLRVNTITEDGIEFVWQEKVNTGLPPRTLFVPMRIRPEVRYVLPGQSLARQGEEAIEPSYGVSAARPTVLPSDKTEPVETTPLRAQVVEDEVTTQVMKPKSEADTVLDMFFNQGGELPEAR